MLSLNRPPSSWGFNDFIHRAVIKLVAEASLSPDDCKTVLLLANSLAAMDIYPEGLLDVLASRMFANWVMRIKGDLIFNVESMAQLQDSSFIMPFDSWPEES